MDQEMQKAYMQDLKAQLLMDYEEKVVYPAYTDIFKALELTPFEKLKVVILGQDPYHGPNQAHGLSFSVPNGIKMPPSLLNIFKELSTDLKVERPTQTDLTSWAKQGVLLLNTTLTVLEGQPLSHGHLGWEVFTDEVLKLINDELEGVVFVLWGAHAQKKMRFIDDGKHFVIKAPHPSPLSAHRGFFGSQPFSAVNQYLTSKGFEPVHWLSIND